MSETLECCELMNARQEHKESNTLDISNDGDADVEPLLNIENVSLQNADPKYSKALLDSYQELQNMENKSYKNDRDSTDSSKFKKIGGCICAVCCIILWVSMSEIIPLLQSDYKKPYFLRYCVGATYSIMLPIWFLLLNKCKWETKITFGMVRGAIILSWVYNLSAYSWYLSLEATIAAINDTMYQFAVCVVYITSVILLPDYKMSCTKNISVIICMLGVGLIAFGTRNESDDTEKNTWYGYVQCFVSLLGYGIFAPLVAIIGKKDFTKSDDDDGGGGMNKLDKIKSKIFMEGMMGISCLLTLWPGLLILHYSKIEVFELPKTREDQLNIIVPAIMDTFYIAAFVVGINLTNPVFMAVAQLLVIPISFMYDVIINDLEITVMAVFGSLFIFIGFLLMELPIKQWVEKYKKHENT